MSILMASDENFDELTKDGVCLVDFYTTHCGPCRALLPTLLEVEARLPFIKLIKVNLDYCKKVGRRYMIDMTPTLYAGKDGDLRELEGAMELDDLLSAMGEVLYGKTAAPADAETKAGTAADARTDADGKDAPGAADMTDATADSKRTAAAADKASGNAAEQNDAAAVPAPPKGKVTLNPDPEVVRQIREGLKAKDGYCPCRRKKTPENKCICKEFREQIADPDFEGFCHCMLYYKSKG